MNKNAKIVSAIFASLAVIAVAAVVIFFVIGNNSSDKKDKSSDSDKSRNEKTVDEVMIDDEDYIEKSLKNSDKRDYEKTETDSKNQKGIQTNIERNSDVDKSASVKKTTTTTTKKPTTTTKKPTTTTTKKPTTTTKKPTTTTRKPTTTTKKPTTTTTKKPVQEVMITDTTFLNEAASVLNTTRSSAGKSGLRADSSLTKVAALRAKEISVNFEGTRPDGRKYTTAYGDCGVELPNYVAECMISSNRFENAKDIIDSWLESSEYRECINDSKYNRFGMAWYKATNGRQYCILVLAD